MQVSFTVNTKEMKKAFQRLFDLNRRTRSSVVTIVVEPDNIELKVPGVSQRVRAEGEGRADVVLPASSLDAYLKTASAATMSFVFEPGQLQCGSSIYSHAGITVEPSPVERVPDVPLNLSPLALLCFVAGKTPEEIKALNLTGQVQYTRKKLQEAVTEATEILKDYNVSYEDLQKMVEQKALPTKAESR